MKHCVLALTLALASSFTASDALAQDTPVASPAAQLGPPRVRFETSMGVFVVRLDKERAPLTVDNFLRYAREGHYDGTIFHRIVDNFVAQGGGYTPDNKLKPTHEPVFNESGNGLTNRRGTIGMARSEGAHSANSQFFINLADNPDLNPLPSRWGYAVFGEVIEGMDVVDRLGHVATGAVGEFTEHAPLKPVIIEKAAVLE